MNVIPYPTPEDEDLLSRITKLATYVARNDTEFEVRVKDKERSNPLFEFLFNKTEMVSSSTNGNCFVRIISILMIKYIVWRKLMHIESSGGHLPAF